MDLIKSYYRTDREVIVAVTCSLCGNLVITDSHHRREYCDRYCCRKNKVDKGVLSTIDKNHIARKYVRDINPQLTSDKKRERLGTYATAGKYGQYPTNKMARKKDGSPDFKMEAKLIRYLKRVTLSPKYPSGSYSSTEGDRIRGLYKDEVVG